MKVFIEIQSLLKSRHKPINRSSILILIDACSRLRMPSLQQTYRQMVKFSESIMNIKEKLEHSTKKHEVALCTQEQVTDLPAAELIRPDLVEELNVHDVEEIEEIHFTIERDHY